MSNIPLDELELCLQVLKHEAAELVNNSSSKELVSLIKNRFNVNCSERDIFLLHEPTLEEEILDVQLQYQIMNGYG